MSNRVPEGQCCTSATISPSLQWKYIVQDSYGLMPVYAGGQITPKVDGDGVKSAPKAEGDGVGLYVVGSFVGDDAQSTSS